MPPLDETRSPAVLAVGDASSLRSLRLAATAACIAVFLVHALDYSYFFVDDEAIPFVYAQNVLHGRGLTYSPSEGAVEGYSDFLQVAIDTVILAGVRLAGADKLDVFAAGACISLLCAVLLLVSVQRLMTRLPGIRPPGACAALAFLALCGPLAVWSRSALEASLFALIVTVLVASLATRRRRPRVVAACTIAAILLRIDGFVYVGIIVCAFLVISRTAERRALLTSVVIPAVVLLAAYHAWRLWYFGHLLPAPISAKVLYKLRGTRGLITKAPGENYAMALLRLYGVVPLALFSAGWIPLRRTRIGVALLLVALLTTAYLSIVGDWMFGFRFFVAVLPVFAILGALTVSAIADRSRTAGWVAAACCVVWAGAVAVRFSARYPAATEREHWWPHRTAQPAVHFKPFYTLYERSREYVQPGDLIAYNQAGFLPFMLDADNIDDVGLCSRFYAELPTTDVFFTETGRYSPLTNRSVFGAGQAYLLYRGPKMIFATRDLIRRANRDREPDGLLDNAYKRVFTDVAGEVAYARQGTGPERFKRDPSAFLENVAHVSRLTRAEIDGRVVDPRRYPNELRHLYEGVQRFHVGAHHLQDLRFADRELPVHQIHVDGIFTTRPISLTLTLRTSGGGAVFSRAVELGRNESRTIHVDLPGGVMASRFTLAAAALTADEATVDLTDLRVQGQTPELAAYVTRTLRFPASQ